jgi:hypothetical protein
MDLTNSPTLTARAHLRQGDGEAGTELGVILGTAAYMAPEQARGRAAEQARGHLGVWLRAVRDADRDARLRRR